MTVRNDFSGQNDNSNPAPGQPIVRIQGLNYYFGAGELRKQVLHDVNLEIPRGQVIIMTGPSGSGKTTLLTLIGALRSIQEGSLQVKGRELSGLSRKELVIVRRSIGFIFQAHNLFESLTAYQNVQMALELAGYASRQKAQQATELLTELGLGERIHYKPQKLSGGQKQRVAIARALANRPELILADEPTAALDKESGQTVINLLKRLVKENQCTILLVTHDNRIFDAADRIVNMVDGEIDSDVLVEQTVEICNFLQKCPVFSRLTPSTLSDVAEKIELENYSAGAVIIRQGEVGDKFYIIRKGSVDVTIDDGKESKVVSTLHEGDFFGELALLTGETRSATVVAKEAVQLYALNKADFEAALETSISFKEELLRIFSQRHRH